MGDLQKKFGRLVAAHRKRASLTQERLAERAGISIDTVRKIETGAAGASFAMIEKLAATLNVDPAELFTTQIAGGAFRRGKYDEISVRLAELSDTQLVWAEEILEVALKGKPPS